MRLKYAAAITLSLSAATFAYSQPATGKQLAQDAMALVAYIELSNIGSRDIECKGTRFETKDVNSVIEGDIRAALVKIAATENKSNKNEVDAVIQAIKQIPMSTRDGKNVLQAVYEKAKRDNLVAYGKQGGCAGLSASFRTVVQQRTLSIRSVLNK